MECSDCGRKAVARGLCQYHYAKARDLVALQQGRICSFDGCGRPRRGNQEHCQLHYNQRVTGKPLAPIKARPKPVFDENGRRRCGACGAFKPEEAFKTGRNVCRACAHNLFRYRMTPQEFAAIIDRQGGGCAICGTTKPGGRWGTWHVDHDHSCCDGDGITTCGKCVRGILCSSCNVGIGHMGNDTARLRAAAAYLEGMVIDDDRILLERAAQP